MTDRNTSTPSNLSREVSLAVRNGLKLMLSLGVTLSVAFVVRFWVPGFLGPEVFGMLHFSEQFSLFLAVIIAFGADVYIRKEVASRPEHASDFFGGLLMFRVVLSLIIGVSISFVLHGMGKEPLVWYLVYFFLLGHFLMVTNVSLGALLEAKGTVTELAAVNAGVKILWGGGCVAGLLLGGGLLSIPLAFVISEGIKIPILFIAARKHLDLRLSFSIFALKAIVIASLPYCANFVALGISNRVGVAILSGMTSDAEVGWFGAAENLTFILFLFIPVLRSVIMPMGARLASESASDHAKVMFASARILLMLSIPLAAILSFNAWDVILILYSEQYGPTAAILRVMAPLVPLTFLCAISSVYMVQVGKIWELVKIHTIAMLVSLPLKVGFIKGFAVFMEGRTGGIALASADVLVEGLIAVLSYFSLRKYVVTQSMGTLGSLTLRLLVVCAIVGAMHPFLAVLGYGRIVVECVAYLIVALPFRTLPIAEFRAVVRRLVKKKHSQ